MVVHKRKNKQKKTVYFCQIVVETPKREYQSITFRIPSDLNKGTPLLKQPMGLTL